MPSGLSRPYGHQGLVDGDEGGTTPPPPTSGFLSTIYAAGLADDPTVDNLMVGPTAEFFVNLGSTPPPFPPTNPAFFPIAALFVGEAPANNGVGADANPLWRTRRHFTTFPSIGDHYNTETRYDLFGSGVNSITGGDRTVHLLVDQFENRLAFKYDVAQLTRPGLFAPGYDPIYLSGLPITYTQWDQMNAIGGGNTSLVFFNSDGGSYRKVLIPNVVGGGGGPAGPWSFVADQLDMNSRNGGEPLVGSELFYDTLTAAAGGHSAINDGHIVLAKSMVLDVKNLGSGQVGGHGNTYARSTLGGALTLVMQEFDSGIVFPKGFDSDDDNTYNGTADTFNSTVTFAGGLQANVTAFLNSGAVVSGGTQTDNLIVDTLFAAFGAGGGGQQTGGAAVAGGTYGATEQTMLQTAYDCLRFFGFLS